MATEEEEQLQSILREYPVFEYDERQKLRCTLTGHDIPARFTELNAYVKTSKFVRAWRIHQIMEKYGDYFDDLGPKLVGCKITLKIIARNPDALLRHISGTKFKRELEKGTFNKENESSGDSDQGEEEMEEDGDMDMGISMMNDDSFSDDDDEELDEDVEYPELTGTGGEEVVESDSYDLAVMDTEKDTKCAERKRKLHRTAFQADTSTTRKKKRTK